METGEFQFRTAAIGGFLKQDVLDYIERANREHRERIEQLEKKVAQHNSIIERTYKLEGEMVEVQHDIRDLKGVK